MEKLDFYLIYKTKSNKWRVFADPAGSLLLFTTMVSAADAGNALLSSKGAVVYVVLDVRLAHHIGHLGEGGYPELALAADPS